MMAGDPGLATLLDLDSDKSVPYGFKDAYQLLKDFFEEVDRVLKARVEKSSCAGK